MNQSEHDEIVKLLRESTDRRRGYADFFSWALNRDAEEWGVVISLAESLAAKDQTFFSEVVSRGRPNDPPDCEAWDFQGRRIAVEVTEIVDGVAIHENKRARVSGFIGERADWSREKFLALLAATLARKDQTFDQLKGGPYPGGYVVVVHTDEPNLGREAVEKYMSDFRFHAQRIDRAFVLISYDPAVEICPFVEVPIGAYPVE